MKQTGRSPQLKRDQVHLIEDETSNCTVNEAVQFVILTTVRENARVKLLFHGGLTRDARGVRPLGCEECRAVFEWRLT